jgi:diacylglycerol kinase (ATP)
MSFARPILVVNTASRTGQEDFDRAKQLLTERQLPLRAAFAVDSPDRLPDVVRQAVADGADLVILGGGDGSVGSVARILADADVVLGLLPTGTANDFARTLGLPSDLAEACAVVAGGKVTAVDVGLVGSGGFLNVASVGMSVTLTESLSPTLKRRIGPLAYPIAAVRAYRSFSTFSARLEFPDGDHEPVELDDLLQVAVANGRYYGGGAVVAPNAGIDDQSLDVYAIPRGTPRQRWRVARHFTSGTFTEEDHVLHLTTRSVRLSTSPDLSIDLDGELIGTTPELFTVRQAGLKVLVPQTADIGIPR